MENKNLTCHSRRSFLRMTGAGAATLAAVTCLPATLNAASVSAPEQQDKPPLPGTEPTELYYWTGWSGLEADKLQELLYQFDEEHDDLYVTMETVYNQYDWLWEKLAEGLPPDVVSAVWLQQLVYMATYEAIQPITEFAALDGVKMSDYFPAVWDSWLWDDDLWGMMITANVKVLAYNPELMTAADLDPAKLPTTLEELDAVIEALENFDDDGNITQTGLLPYDVQWWSRIFGGDFYDAKNNKITADSDENVAAMEWVAGHSERLGLDKIETFASNWGAYASAENSFLTGQEAMRQAGDWFVIFQEYFAPEAPLSMFAAPSPKGGRENCTLMDGSIFTIPTDVPNAESSWELIRWLNEDRNMSQFAYQIYNVPTKIALANNEELLEDDRYSTAVELLSSENVFGPDKMPVSDYLAALLVEAESNVVLGKADAREALAEVSALAQTQLDEIWPLNKDS